MLDKYAIYTIEQCQNRIRVCALHFQTVEEKNTVESSVQTEHVEFKELQQLEGNLVIKYYGKKIRDAEKSFIKIYCQNLETNN